MGTVHINILYIITLITLYHDAAKEKVDPRGYKYTTALPPMCKLLSVVGVGGQVQSYPQFGEKDLKRRAFDSPPSPRL